MRAVEVCDTLEERVCFTEVVDRRGPIPPGCRFLVQLARNNNWSPKWRTEKVCGYGSAYMRDVYYDPNAVCPAAIEAEAINEGCCECPQTDCNGCLINPQDKIWYRPFFDQLYMASQWIGSSYYKNNYTPIRLANHTFFNTLVFPEYDLPYVEDEYNVVGEELLFNFKEGSIAISYLGVRLDEKMRPMVPDSQEFFQAFRAYVAMVKANIRYEVDPTAENYRFSEVKKDDWQWYCGQAKTYAFKPKTIDERQNIAMANQHLIKQNSYFNMFGSMSRPDPTRYGINGSIKGV